MPLFQQCIVIIWFVSPINLYTIVEIVSREEEDFVFWQKNILEDFWHGEWRIVTDWPINQRREGTRRSRTATDAIHTVSGYLYLSIIIFQISQNRRVFLPFAGWMMDICSKPQQSDNIQSSEGCQINDDSEVEGREPVSRSFICYTVESKMQRKICPTNWNRPGHT